MDKTRQDLLTQEINNKYLSISKKGVRTMQKVTEVTFNETLGDYNKEIYISGEIEDVVSIINVLGKNKCIGGQTDINVALHGDENKDATEEHYRKIKSIMETANPNM